MSSAPRATRSRTRRTTALVASGATLLAVSVVGFAPGSALASSHREAPLIAGDPLADNTDTYMFVSPDDPNTVTLIANWIPLQEPNGGPTFYPWGTGVQGYYYDIKIDNDGDAVSDLTYRWTFSTQSSADRGTADFQDDTFLYADGAVTSLDDENLLFKQTYDITVSTDNGATFPTTIVDDADVAPSNIGPAAMPNYDADLFAPAVTDVVGGGQSYAGQADDPFFLDLRVFDLLYGGGVKADGSGLNEVGQDTLAGYNVNTVVLKLPKAALALNGTPDTNPVIGMWSTTERQSVVLTPGAQTAGGPEVQVSRLGSPLVNEVVVPTTLKDAFNAGEPVDDAGAAGGAILNKVLDPEVPKLIEAIYGAPAPDAPRTDLAEIFLTGVTTAFDGSGLYASLGDPADAAPIPLDLNSQALNADYTDGTFVPSEMLRLNMALNGPTSLTAEGTPGPALPEASPLGVVGGDIQGYPNGRRLADDVIDISLVAVGGQFAKDFTPDDDRAANAQAEILAAVGGDQVGVNDREFSTTFPFIASPNNESVNQAEGGTVTINNPAPGTTPPATTAPGNGGIKTPVGGVDTGAGGATPSSLALPLVSGAAAVLLLAAGGASLVSNRRKRAAGEDDAAE